MDQTNRRRFLGTLSTLGLGTFLLPDILASVPLDNKIDTFGLIASMLGKELNADTYKAVLPKIAEMGYREIEFGGHLGASPEAYYAFLKEIGLCPVAGGSSMAELLKKGDEIIRSQLLFEKKYLVCYWPWMDGGDNITPEITKQAAANLNEIGKKCKAAGIKLALHNHDKEYFPFADGSRPYDIFLSETDPDLVTMEIDIYWIRKAGGDIFQYFRKYPGRFEICHIKDMDDSPEQAFACPGAGVIDFAAIFRERELAGLRHFIVEHDRPADPLACARQGAEFLKALRF